MALTVCYRVAGHPEALWKLPNLRAGRYNELGDPPTQYLSLHPLTPWAEAVRNARLRRRDLRAEDFRLRLWAVRVETESLLRLDLGTADQHGIDPGDLVADDQAACRALGRRLRAEHPGIVCPSAALPGAENVVLFGERYESPYLDDPIGELDVPTAPAAEGGRPVTELLALVRLHGEPHAALEARRSGEGFVFEEPALSQASTE